jgi:hypothetical protein
VAVLWVLAALVAAGLAAALLVSRGGSARSGVTAYIAAVNESGRTFARDYRSVSEAYRTFTLAPQRAARQLPRLRAASRRLTRLRIELQRIPAPPAARVLRGRLIAFYRQEEAVAAELVGMTAYVPQLTSAERPLAAASARMRAALAGGKTPEQQAAALGAYVGALTAARRAVRAIDPPPLFAGSHRAQAAHLDASIRSIDGLRRALLTHSRSKVKAAVAGLQTAGVRSPVLLRGPIAAYNRHVRELRRLGAAVERERVRLNGTLR